MYKILFEAAEKRQFEFGYQNLLFPQKPELNEQEEVGLRNLLVAFEAVGMEKEIRVGGESVPTQTLDGQAVVVEVVDERDFKLLKQLVKAAKPNGLWVRDKLALVDKLEAVKNDEGDKNG